MGKVLPDLTPVSAPNIDFLTKKEVTFLKKSHIRSPKTSKTSSFFSENPVFYVRFKAVFLTFLGNLTPLLFSPQFWDLVFP